ncbi:MAG TPA: hypothetical protein VIA06_24375 [Candidatus Dormibacteraeota bacterium]|nr:hypothetical protein [Candidatus Dormibacteraeota bacterium]
MSTWLEIGLLALLAGVAALRCRPWASLLLQLEGVVVVVTKLLASHALHSRDARDPGRNG